MSKYFRITGYAPQADLGFIMDCYGMHEELWEFSSAMVKRGFKILAVGDSDKFLEGNIRMMKEKDTENYVCRAYQQGMPTKTTYTIDGVTYEAYKVDDKTYVPNRAVLA